jgi:hypothetical protein
MVTQKFFGALSLKGDLEFAKCIEMNLYLNMDLVLCRGNKQFLILLYVKVSCAVILGIPELIF